MPTTKKRMNISLSTDVEKTIARLAKRDQVPEATKAVQLLRLALEIEGDAVWDRLASERDTSRAKFISHKEAWL